MDYRHHFSISPETAVEDAAVARDMDCEECGRHGLDYDGFYDNGNYVAIAECPECGHRQEF